LKRSYSAALGGISAALSLVFLLAAIYSPAGKLALYALSSVPLLMPLRKGMYGTAALVYAATGLLALLVSGNPLYVAPYWLLFGVHPLLIALPERFKLNAVITAAIKLIYFNLALLAAYKLSALFFIDLSAFENRFYGILALAASAAFMVYDFLITRIYKKSDKYIDRIIRP